MPSNAQILANQANSLKSSGPVSDEGKARVSVNALTHGLAGEFRVLYWECPNQFKAFSDRLTADFDPQTGEERRLVSAMIHHQWLMHRALTLQDVLLQEGIVLSDSDRQKLALFIRYQTTNERSYYKAMRELLTIRKQKHAEEIGFESQNRKAAEEQRKQEAHQARTRLTNARAAALEIETEVRQTVELPLPGNTRMPFADIQDACATAIRSLAEQTMQKTAA